MKKKFAANNESVKLLTMQGWTCAVVEQTIGGGSFIKRDAFGFADILCMSPSKGTMLVQATAGGHLAERVAKIKAEPRAAIWLASKNRIQVHDWIKQAGQKDRICRIMEIVPKRPTVP